MSDTEFERRRLEYMAAQEMLRHYDSLNWQIGSILIAASILMTGLILRKESVDLIRLPGAPGWLITLGVPLLSFFVLGIWFLWFRRHRILYNLRNETLHRLEVNLGMYHYLRVVEADLNSRPHTPSISSTRETINAARRVAGYGEGGFDPIYPISKLPSPSGFLLAGFLAFGIPIFQAIIFLGLKCA